MLGVIHPPSPSLIGCYGIRGKQRCGEFAIDPSIVAHSPPPKAVITAINTDQVDSVCPILPGLPDDIALDCLALVPRCHYPAVGRVCKRWRSVLQSKEFTIVRKLAGRLEEWIYMLISDGKGKGSHWEIVDYLNGESRVLPPMPGPIRASFGTVVLDSKLLVLAGYIVDEDSQTISADVYEYDSRLNRWTSLAKLNVARYDFACSVVDGMVYVAGGYGADGDSLASAEIYNSEKNEWTVIESMRRPRWGCFACCIQDKFYVMGGRSAFTIGNSKYVDVYNPKQKSWNETKNGCVMATAHAVLGDKLYCVEWKNERKLAIFDPSGETWSVVAIPLTGSSSVGFCLGVLEGKLLLFSMEPVTGYKTLLYDPDAAPGSEWRTCNVKPSRSCLCSVTISA